jgi:hypothetical protein
MLTRLPDWQSRLQSCLDSRRAAAFQYGIFDCCLFSCDCVEAMTGHDMAAWFRGRYSTRKQALELVRERTGHPSVKAIAEYAAAECEMRPVGILMAQRGDMVLVGKGSKAVLGIVSLLGTDVMCQGTSGITRVAFEHAVAAWRV